MNPTHLLTFAVVARLQSITRAAQQLHLGQPAVSGQLKLLQRVVGEPLYERQGHRIKLTPAGEGLLRHAERVEAEFFQTKEFIRRLQRADAGVLRIGSTTTIASYYLPPYVVELQNLHPGVQVFMKTGDSAEILRNLNDYDLGFVEGPVAAEALMGHYQMLPWKQDEIVLVVRDDHELVGRYPDGVPLEVFSRYQVIWREPGSGARQVVERALATAGIEVPVHIEVTGAAGVKGAVRAGLGIGFASFQALRDGGGGLIALRIDPPVGLTWQLNVIAPEPRLQSRALQAFLQRCFDARVLPRSAQPDSSAGVVRLDSDS